MKKREKEDLTKVDRGQATDTLHVGAGAGVEGRVGGVAPGAVLAVVCELATTKKSAINNPHFSVSPLFVV